MDSAWIDTLTRVGAVLPDSVPVDTSPAPPLPIGPVGLVLMVCYGLLLVIAFGYFLARAGDWWHDGVDP